MRSRLSCETIEHCDDASPSRSKRCFAMSRCHRDFLLQQVCSPDVPSCVERSEVSLYFREVPVFDVGIRVFVIRLYCSSECMYMKKLRLECG